MSIQNMLIRKFSPRDLSRVIEIERASFEIDFFSESTFRRYYHECPDLFILAEISGEIVGYMITCIYLEQAIIVSIAIEPTNKRQGVGTHLTNHTLNQLESFGEKEVELKVRTTNTASIRFWESLGFLPMEIIRSYYLDGEDALRMRAWLESQ